MTHLQAQQVSKEQAQQVITWSQRVSKNAKGAKFYFNKYAQKALSQRVIKQQTQQNTQPERRQYSVKQQSTKLWMQIG